eukprot:CAMPEP_0176309288 /NCGR_PEP_ID=MMETSP0121_2-20121125/64999_1 /TAXON_ID=160619 /ORGANISM="Kryptoperidinium foliaceum, Strain CCMP 1326" /LENGTH=71 /DNA_ID=CAMNT_0017651181 /DNA_START=21 /DNA_END=232 /DNA_ORIENTATION=+
MSGDPGAARYISRQGGALRGSMQNFAGMCAETTRESCAQNESDYNSTTRRDSKAQLPAGQNEVGLVRAELG